MPATLTLRERFDPRRFFQGGKAVDGPVTLGHRNVFIVPNKRGFGLALLLLLQLLASINYNNSLGFILSFLMGSIAMLGAVYGFRNLAGLELRAGRAEPVFAGEAAKFKLFIDNPTQALRIALRVGLRHGPAQALNLLPGENRQAVLSLEAARRGWLDLPTVTLSSVFPLGLFHAWSPLRLKERVLVYPRPAPDSLPFPSSPGGDGGNRRASADDFHGFQSYQPGDPLRRIHWKGVAKGQGVHVKEYRGEESVQLYLDWAQTPGHDAEARLSRLCRWVLDAEQSGAVYGLRLPGTDIKPASGPGHVRMCLESLALFGSRPE
jgi:uncharacterized protein (DUF58 family)